jgi:hypothetical protein
MKVSIPDKDQHRLSFVRKSKYFMIESVSIQICPIRLILSGYVVSEVKTYCAFQLRRLYKGEN